MLITSCQFVLYSLVKEAVSGLLVPPVTICPLLELSLVLSLIAAFVDEVGVICLLHHPFDLRHLVWVCEERIESDRVGIDS